MLIRILLILCLSGIAAMSGVLFVAVLCDAPSEFTDKVFKLMTSLCCVMLSGVTAEMGLCLFGDRK